MENLKIDDLFKTKELKDFGLYLHETLKRDNYDFESLNIDALTKIIEGLFAANISYTYHGTEYTLSLIFPQRLINQVISDLELLDEDFAHNLDNDLCMSDPMEEVSVPDYKLLNLLLTAELDLENEKGYMLDNYLPFIVTEINGVSLIVN